MVVFDNYTDQYGFVDFVCFVVFIHTYKWYINEFGLIIIIIITINDTVYGVVIVTMVTARVHPVHLMNAD